MTPAAHPDRPLRVVGLMSGTSMDGVDAAWLDTDGETVAGFGPSETYAYDEKLRSRLRSAAMAPDALDDAERAALAESLTDAHAATVERLLDAQGLPKPDLIGFHGHTILHRPERRYTLQIGDGARLAATLGVAVVNDFRSADVEAGGQGAPLVPLYHRALAQGLDAPLAVFNIGGVANVTWIDGDDVLAFDTGPGGALLDDWARSRRGMDCDRNGALSGAGRVLRPILGALASHGYFSKKPPKSLDRNDFSAAILSEASDEDGAATLAAFTAVAAARAAEWFPRPAKRWLVAGGGRRNPTLMRMLAQHIDAPVDPAEAVGWDGDALEAQAFAFLAARVLRGLPTSLPGTTGAPRPICGGRIHRP